jgi:hypothetical protein
VLEKEKLDLNTRDICVCPYTVLFVDRVADSAYKNKKGHEECNYEGSKLRNVHKSRLSAIKDFCNF